MYIECYCLFMCSDHMQGLYVYKCTYTHACMSLYNITVHLGGSLSLFPIASGDGVLSGRCVAVSELLKEEHKKRVMELLQQLQGVYKQCVGEGCVGVSEGVWMWGVLA